MSITFLHMAGVLIVLFGWFLRLKKPSWKALGNLIFLKKGLLREYLHDRMTFRWDRRRPKETDRTLDCRRQRHSTEEFQHSTQRKIRPVAPPSVPRLANPVWSHGSKARTDGRKGANRSNGAHRAASQCAAYE